ncbi:DUF3823 domain-containing protein [Dysgonomonas sp. Marseille-P4677]|uniref:DUF3823 domain-containing protein n=1 Tax=Dysgonomonas sp. Marseille-P4677 TaxID=2364790 RepID=UPI001913998C|nr:DUF3823 domain-containing protein [Dysgonomonas sp. Marseille-P4677]MBK5722710.1 DUF3823 domain-containing protein [Dysgonomonas sp. Marseille-P4677]
MKQAIFIISGIIYLLLLVSCGKDNYEEPESELIGKITYNGQSIGLRGSGEKVQMQLYQDGFALRKPIPVYVSQEGTFSAKLFDGTYKLVTRDNNGPWVNKRDTVVVEVRGNTVCEYPVTPYYMIRNEAFSVSSNKLKATCKIEEITPGKQVSSVVLIINKGIFVDDVSSLAKVSVSKPGNLENINIEMDLSTRTEPILYGRIGVQISGVNDYLFSKIVQIK